MVIGESMKRITCIIAICLTACIYMHGTAAGENPEQDGAVGRSIPPGTVITMANWQQYRGFMPDGMAALFEGKYFWKMPPDVHIEIGPTVIRPLPKNYLAATERYAPAVRVIELPNGGLTLTNYRGGIPFPNPAEPHKGWKTLANIWYRYIPYLAVETYGAGCAIDSTRNYNCQAYSWVKRQLSYNTDPNAPVETASPNARYFTEWFMELEPEQERYTAYLTVNYADPTRPEEQYAFLPALRRYQPISTLARCAETGGMDATSEDFHNGFDSNITELNVEYVAHRKIIALIDPQLPTAPFPADVDMPLGWPTPKWGRWQVRDVDEVAIKKIPARAGSYCYGRRVMYADSHFASPLWEEMDDKHLKPWKMMALFPLKVAIPGVGDVNTAPFENEVFWDIQRNHASFNADPSLGRPYYINEQAPREYHDDSRYTTPAGLNMIMR